MTRKSTKTQSRKWIGALVTEWNYWARQSCHGWDSAGGAADMSEVGEAVVILMLEVVVITLPTRKSSRSLFATCYSICILPFFLSPSLPASISFPFFRGFLFSFLYPLSCITYIFFNLCQYSFIWFTCIVSVFSLHFTFFFLAIFSHAYFLYYIHPLHHFSFFSLLPSGQFLVYVPFYTSNIAAHSFLLSSPYRIYFSLVSFTYTTF